MMRKNADDRFQDCQQLKDALTEFSNTGKVSLEQYATISNSKAATATATLVSDSVEGFPNLALTGSPGSPTATQSGDSSHTLDPADSSSIPIQDRSNAKVRTDEISAVQTTETPVLQASEPDSPFAIDTLNVSGNPKASSIKRAGMDEVAAVKRFGRSVNARKRKQAVPGWVLGIMIGLMIVIMLIVLVIVNYLISKPEKPATGLNHNHFPTIAWICETDAPANSSPTKST